MQLDMTRCNIVQREWDPRLSEEDEIQDSFKTWWKTWLRLTKMSWLSKLIMRPEAVEMVFNNQDVVVYKKSSHYFSDNSSVNKV